MASYASVRNATIEYCCGLAVGFLPLLCHGFMHFTSEKKVDFSENWSTDIIFVGVVNSGLLVSSTFGRTIIRKMNLNAYCAIFGVLNFILALFLALAYANVAIGNSKLITVPLSLWMLAASIILSAIVEISFVLEN